METKGVEVILSKIEWNQLIKRKLRILRIFDESELPYEFGDYPEQYIVRVKITKQKKKTK